LNRKKNGEQRWQSRSEQAKLHEQKISYSRKTRHALKAARVAKIIEAQAAKP